MSYSISSHNFYYTMTNMTNDTKTNINTTNTMTTNNINTMTTTDINDFMPTSTNPVVHNAIANSTSNEELRKERIAIIDAPVLSQAAVAEHCRKLADMWEIVPMIFRRAADNIFQGRSTTAAHIAKIHYGGPVYGLIPLHRFDLEGIIYSPSISDYDDTPEYVVCNYRDVAFYATQRGVPYAVVRLQYECGEWSFNGHSWDEDDGMFI